MPTVSNPTMPTENFNRHWDQEKYKNFRKCFHRYTQGIREAYDEEMRDESIRKWRGVFGEAFAKGEIISNNLGKSSSIIWPDSGFLMPRRDMLEICPPHQQRLQWRYNRKLDLHVHATVHQSRNCGVIAELQNNQDVISPNLEVKFQVKSACPREYDLWYQVVNTGIEARRADQLRGGFSYLGRGGKVWHHWESVRYVGSHWIEFFLVSRRLNECVARSGRFVIHVH